MRDSHITPHFKWSEAEDREGHEMLWAVIPEVTRMAYKLEELREEVGHPLRISSWFRHQEHSIEAAKKSPGVHTTGLAVDIPIGPDKAYALVSAAFYLGFKGIGISQREGKDRFVHLDIAREENRIWSY